MARLQAGHMVGRGGCRLEVRKLTQHPHPTLRSSPEAGAGRRQCSQQGGKDRPASPRVRSSGLALLPSELQNISILVAF